MALTQQHLDDLEEALASGALRVQYRDKTVTYASREDLLARIRYVRAELQGTRGQRVRTLSSHTKGHGHTGRVDRTN